MAGGDRVKINWKLVKHLDAAWSHIRTSLDGEEDTALCVVCRSQFELPPHARLSKLLLVARTHYYKHKRWEALHDDDRRIAAAAPARAEQLPELFPL
jgi:hypothetical protein